MASELPTSMASASTVTLIDFASTPLAASYNAFYTQVIDNVFTPSECDELISLACGNADGWKPAGLSAENGSEIQAVHNKFRNSERTLMFNDELAKRVFERLKPLVEDEIGVIEPNGRWGGVTGKVGRKQGPLWRLHSVNPRLSFLRYGPGHYFKPHCDGLVEVKASDNESKPLHLESFVTLHLYLTDTTTELQNEELFTASSSSSATETDSNPKTSIYDDDDDVGSSGSPQVPSLGDTHASLSGGATRFWTPNKKHHLDVEPKVGRVLVFQQRMLVHSGEMVTRGMKYTMRSDFLFSEL